MAAELVIPPPATIVSDFDLRPRRQRRFGPTRGRSRRGRRRWRRDGARRRSAFASAAAVAALILHGSAHFGQFAAQLLEGTLHFVDTAFHVRSAAEAAHATESTARRAAWESTAAEIAARARGCSAATKSTAAEAAACRAAHRHHRRLWQARRVYQALLDQLERGGRSPFAEPGGLRFPPSALPSAVIAHAFCASIDGSGPLLRPGLDRDCGQLPAWPRPLAARLAESAGPAAVPAHPPNSA